MRTPESDAADRRPVDISALARAGTTLLCPIAVRCVAMLAPDVADRAVADMPEHRGTTLVAGWTVRSAAPELMPLWTGIKRLRLPPFLIRHHVAEVEFRNGRAYAGMGFEGLDRLPETLKAALPGRPMITVVDHPLFEGLTLHAANDGSVRGPGPAIPLDDLLPLRIADERRRMKRALARRGR